MGTWLLFFILGQNTKWTGSPYYYLWHKLQKNCPKIGTLKKKINFELINNTYISSSTTVCKIVVGFPSLTSNKTWDPFSAHSLPKYPENSPQKRSRNKIYFSTSSDQHNKPEIYTCVAFAWGFFMIYLLAECMSYGFGCTCKAQQTNKTVQFLHLAMWELSLPTLWICRALTFTLGICLKKEG